MNRPGPQTKRRTFLRSLLLVLGVAVPAMIISAPGGHSRGDNGEVPYRFSCGWASLTADFAGRDQLPQTPDPPADWYRTDGDGRFVNRGWGPRANALAPPEIPRDAGCDPSTWKRERVLAAAMRYIDAPGNPLGLQYRHHHIPAWDPPASTYADVSEENPDTEAPAGPTAWGPGRGLDCSNFTAWVYNYGLGIKFGGDVHQQFDGSAGPMGRRVPSAGPFELGDLIYLHPNGNGGDASHVVIYIDDDHIIDSRVNAEDRVGVQVRDRVGWYRTAVLGAWRPIG